MVVGALGLGGCESSGTFIEGERPFRECEEQSGRSACLPGVPDALLAFTPRPGEPEAVAVVAAIPVLSVVESGAERSLEIFNDNVHEYPVQEEDHLMVCAVADGRQALVYGAPIVRGPRTWTPQYDGSWVRSPDLRHVQQAPACARLHDGGAEDLLGLWTPEGVVRVATGASDLRELVELPLAADPELRIVLPGARAAGDLDGDGVAELVVASDEPPRLLVFHGLSGSVAQFTSWDIELLRVVDLEVLPEPPGTLLVLGEVDEEGAGLLTRYSIDPRTHQPVDQVSVPTGSAPSGLVPRDLDGDGGPDVVVQSMPGDSLWLHPIDADGSPQPAEPLVLPSLSMDATLADLDGDGALDLVTLPVGTDRVEVHWGDGQGEFEGL